MKYFNPSYWFKLWLLSAPLFNDKTQGINAKSIDNKNIKDWTSKNITNLDSINESLILSNNNQTTEFINYKTYLDLKKLDKLTSTELAVIPYHHKHRNEKSRNRHKREILDYENNNIYFYNTTNSNVYYFLFKDNNFEKEIFIFKVDGINEKIKEIIKHFISDNEFYFLSTTGNIYYLNSYSDTAIRLDDTYYYNIKKMLKWSANVFYFLKNDGEVFYSYKNFNQVYKVDGINEPIEDIMTSWRNGIYFLSTTGNVYCVSHNRWVAYKIEGINEKIKDMKSSNTYNGLYFLSESGYVYYLANNWWTAVRIDTYYNVTEIQNVKSIIFLFWNAVQTCFNTNNGIYSIFSDNFSSIIKYKGISEKIKDIKKCSYNIPVFPFSSENVLYFLSESGYVYYLKPFWKSAVRIDTYYNVPELKNIVSIDFLKFSFECNSAYFTTDNGFYYLKNEKIYKMEDWIKFNPYYSFVYPNILQVNGDFYDINNSKKWKRMKNKIGTENIINYKFENFFLLENEKFNNLKKHFSDWNKQIIINLGLINDNSDKDIKNALKQKYRNLIINDIGLFNKEYSHFNQDYKSNFAEIIKKYPELLKYTKNSDTTKFAGFSVKLKIKSNSENYPHGILKPKLSYVTQTKLNEISSIIKNDEKVKQWIEHINDYNKTTVPVKINELNIDIQHLKNSYPIGKELDEKINIKIKAFKVEQKEILKGYIRDWSYVSTLIEHEFKLDELNKNVQGLKSSFDEIKNQINELDNNLNKLNKRVTELENTSNWNCGNIATVIAAIPIPIINDIVASVSTIISGACAIAGV